MSNPTEGRTDEELDLEGRDEVLDVPPTKVKQVVLVLSPRAANLIHYMLRPTDLWWRRAFDEEGAQEKVRRAILDEIEAQTTGGSLVITPVDVKGQKS